MFKLVISPNCLRKDGDSNPGYAFGVYTLSRRASSTTRASFPTKAIAIRVAIYNIFCKLHSISQQK